MGPFTCGPFHGLARDSAEKKEQSCIGVAMGTWLLRLQETRVCLPTSTPREETVLKVGAKAAGLEESSWRFSSSSSEKRQPPHLLG